MRHTPANAQELHRNLLATTLPTKMVLPPESRRKQGRDKRNFRIKGIRVATTRLIEAAELAGFAVGPVSNFLNYPDRDSPQAQIWAQELFERGVLNRTSAPEMGK